MAGSYIVNVPKLKGRENYDEWAFAAENFLILDGVDISKEVKTEDADSAEEKKSKAKLIMTIDSTLYVHIKNEKTTRDIWKRLKTLFDDSGFSRRINLLRQLISIRLEDSDSMTAYVTQMVDTAQKLKGTGFQITDEWVGSLLLAGLTDKFAPMIMAIEHSGMTISTDAIKAKLLDMETDVGVTEGALLSKNWHQHKKPIKKKTNMPNISNLTNSKSIKTVRCYRCKQLGHYMNKCSQNNQNRTDNAFSAIFLNSANQFRESDWYIDSGASSHMVVDKRCLENVSLSHKVKDIVVANKETLPVLCAGSTRITTVVNDSEFDITVEDVLCIPRLTTNLLSVSQLIRKGNKVNFGKEVCYIRNRHNELIGKADLVNGVYRLDIKSEKLFAGSATATTSEMWHRRFGHINSKDLNTMRNGVVDGIDFSDRAVIDKSQCITCCQGKQTRLPFTHKGTRCENVLEVVHADVCGPMEQVSIGLSRYFLLFVDDYSRMAFVYFLKAKHEVFDYLKEFKALVERQTGRKLKVLRTDNGGEFCSSQIESFLKKAGIAHQKTTPYTPEQNGMCERLNRTVVERARCMLFDAKLSKRFWAEAVNTAVYLRNRTLASGLTKTPYELWTGKKPDVSHLRVFGSKAMALIPKVKTAKWDKKAETHIFVGYENNIKGYRLYNPKTNKIITSRDVIIMEKADDSLNITQAEIMEEQINNTTKAEETKTRTSDVFDILNDETESGTSSSTSDELYNSVSESEALNSPDKPVVLKKRQIKPPDRYGFSNLCVEGGGNECLTMNMS